MAYVRIRPRRSTAEEWEYNNPILAEGEMGVEVPPTGVGTGAVKIKFGDGVSAWKDLPYGIDFENQSGGSNSGNNNSGSGSGNNSGDSSSNDNGFILDENDKIETDEIPTEEIGPQDPDIDDEVTIDPEEDPTTGGDDTGSGDPDAPTD